MYTITFYSFKGGVGRTMAMVNVGLALARSGRRVLLVDFDLEAPGLDTFSLLRPSHTSPGIVDYVTEFTNTGIAPDVNDFVYEPSHPGLDGTVWVMPSGKQDEYYGSRLNSIDWNHLYSDQDGFLLFEDLKKQIDLSLQPDYVFIDSRTGHTDTGGICTRQLPDAVVLFFFPNEQNRRGLETVVRDIRKESGQSGRLVELYFVASNVPDLDDEDSTLRERLRQFQKTLATESLATIHHYDSLALIEQTVFTIERPRTKLAREYNRLAKRITSKNLKDREVVLSFLDDVASSRRIDEAPEVVKRRLADIKLNYGDDVKVLYELAQAYRNLGLTEESEQQLAEAQSKGFLTEEQLRDKAIQEYTSGSHDSARVYVRRVLDVSRKPFYALDRFWSVIIENDPQFLAELLHELNSRGLQSTEKLYIADQLVIRRDILPAVEEFLRPLVIAEDGSKDAARRGLALCLIAQRKYAEAQDLIRHNAPTLSDLSIEDSFNYAVATWGATKSVPRDLFLQVVAMDDESPRPFLGPNYSQCLAIANWAVGRADVARKNSLESRSKVKGRDNEFSAWRYLRVSSEAFLADLDSLDTMIGSGVGQPVIIDDQD